MSYTLLDFIENEDKPLTIPEIVERADIPPTRLYGELKKLRDSGKVKVGTIEQILRDGK